MKKSICLLALLIAVMLVGCQQKTSQADVKKTEATLYNSDMTMNQDVVPEAVDTYSKYVEDNPNAADAPDVLLKAIEVSVFSGQDASKSIELVNKLATAYPNHENTPAALSMLASYVYDQQLHDMNKARATYERVIKDYPDTQWATDARILVEMIGMSDDEMLEKIKLQSGEAE